MALPTQPPRPPSPKKRSGAATLASEHHPPSRPHIRPATAATAHPCTLAPACIGPCSRPHKVDPQRQPQERPCRTSSAATRERRHARQPSRALARTSCRSHRTARGAVVEQQKPPPMRPPAGSTQPEPPGAGSRPPEKPLTHSTCAPIHHLRTWGKPLADRGLCPLACTGDAEREGGDGWWWWHRRWVPPVPLLGATRGREGGTASFFGVSLSSTSALILQGTPKIAPLYTPFRLFAL